MKQKEIINERLKKYSANTSETMFEELQISGQGLTKKQAAMQRQKYGTNSWILKNRASIYVCLKKAFINPFSTILFFLGLISLFTDVFFPEDYQKNISSVFIIFIMLIISGTIRFIQELHSKHIADQLFQIVNTTVNVLRDGEWKEINSGEVVVGDQIRLEAGDRVPADLRLINSTDLFVSQSIITGESIVLEKNSEVLKVLPQRLNDYKNLLFSGSIVTGGKGTGVVIAVGQSTVYGGLSVTDSERRSGFDRGANSIAMVLIRFMVILIPIVFIASGLTKRNWLEAFLFALSAAVGLTPELLPMVVTACLAKGSFNMGRKRTIVKNVNAMQSFGSMDILCIDKTGTLTGDQLLLEYYMDILGNENQKTLDYAFLSSYYNTSVKNHIDTAICKVADLPEQKEYFQELRKAYGKLDEIPFDYNRRYASILLKHEEQKILIVKGSIDEVVKHCSYAEYRGEKHAINKEDRNSAHEIVDEMLEDGMKVIALAYKEIDKDTMTLEEENDLTLLGYLAFFDAPKKSAASAIKKLHDLNINCKVLSGDHKQVVLSVCRRLGINTEFCLTGMQLDEVSENELPIVLEKTNVFAELSPKQKAMIVENLQINGHEVGFLGDGMNDLPAVLQADVGISVENATDAVRESANVILLKKDLDILEQGIIEGRSCFANMTKYIKITASSNFGNICSIVLSSVLLPFLPITSIQILLINLLYDILCLVLPWDKVDEDMIKKPLKWTGQKLGKFMIYFGLSSSIFDILTYVFLYFIMCPLLCGGGYFEISMENRQQFIALFQTGWFLETMWTQLLILQLLRTKKLPFIQSKPSRNVILVTIIGIMLFTMLPYTVIGRIINLTILPPLYYAFLILCVILYLLFITLAKQIYVNKNKELI